jgi:tight adherence protein C
VTAGTVGALVGLTAGAGGWVVVSRLPWRRRPTFHDRVAPYLQDSALPSRLLASGPLRPGRGGSGGRLQTWWAATMPEVALRLDRTLGGSSSIRRRVDELGAGSLEQVRTEQIVWAATSLGSVLALGLVRNVVGSPAPPAALAVLSVVCAVVAVAARDRALTRAVARRRTRIVAEFPTVAELLALSVAAGEGPLGALERVSRLCGGELGRELGRALAEARAGASLVDALHQLADRVGVPVLRRFVDGLVVAVERGSPLSEVLRAQAVDVREAGRRALIETAARREIAMMVPVVFLVLPVSVVFALFPGFYGLALSA